MLAVRIRTAYRREEESARDKRRRRRSEQETSTTACDNGFPHWCCDRLDQSGCASRKRGIYPSNEVRAGLHEQVQNLEFSCGFAAHAGRRDHTRVTKRASQEARFASLGLGSRPASCRS